jgi:transcriptional regulator with XRE-family HTH domain
VIADDETVIHVRPDENSSRHRPTLHYNATKEERMSTTIADTRRAVGWTVRELAENMGVAPSTVTRMEQSEREDRIQLGTLKRALGVMGRYPRVDVVNSRREERVTMEFHRALARKLASDPQAVLEVVPKNLGRLRARLTSPIGQRWVDRWVELVDSPVDVLIDGMLADTPEGRELRQNSPFAGALTQDERLAAILRANQA